MKLFYFGSVCSSEIFNRTVAESRVKPSASAQNFEYALIKGFSNIPNLEITAASAESISTFPSGNRLFLKKRKDKLTDNCTSNIIPAVNLPLIKQINHANGAGKLLKKWLKQNESAEDKCVFVYGIYPSVAQKLISLCRRNNCKTVAVITDVPSTMFTYTKSKSLLKRLFSGSYREKAVELQDKFDGYVYLTEAMAEEVAPAKPYTVVETVADTAVFDGVSGDEYKTDRPALMYAGALYQKYGLDKILDSFSRLKTDAELWLFGSGDYEEEILRRAEQDRRIKYFGRVSREEVLKREKAATLLLNIRNASDGYTKYSFPSKTVEYMLSGTPLFTTRLSGIPAEYYEYVFSTDSTDPDEIALQIDNILSDPEHLISVGEKAEQFVRDNKNQDFQAQEIIGFIKKVISIEGCVY